MGKIQRIAIRLRSIKNSRLNELYKICERKGLTVQETECVKYLINNM